MLSRASFLAVCVRFGTLPRFKAKFHEERTLGYLTLQYTPYSSSVIATNPFMLIRMSALAHNLAPTLASDTAPRRKQAWPSSRASLPAQQVCPFNITLFRSLTNRYPFPDVVVYVLAVLEASQDFFVGDRSKPVDMEPRHHPPNVTLQIHTAMLKGVAEGWTLAPTAAPLLPNSRPTPVGFKKKNKYDLICTKVRVTHGFDAGPCPLNDLYFRPRWLDYHFSARHLSDIIAFLGPGTRMTTRDVPSAFKHLKIPVSDLARHVTVTQHPATGSPLYWQEMAREFGHRKSETGWHGFKGLLLYCLRLMAPIHLSGDIYGQRLPTSPPRISSFHASRGKAG